MGQRHATPEDNPEKNLAILEGEQRNSMILAHFEILAINGQLLLAACFLLTGQRSKKEAGAVRPISYFGFSGICALQPFSPS